MKTSLDWLSFSLFHEEDTLENEKHAILSAQQTLASRFQFQIADTVSPLKMENGAGRKPYSVSVRTEHNELQIFAHPRLPHFLVEFSGRGCDMLLAHAYAEHVLNNILTRVTRIDIACDMECKTDPREFVSYREEGRFKSKSEVVSESGITCYVGSKSSDRYARVYRYLGKHPRAHLLRAEHVFKGEEAKTALAYLITNGYEAIAAQSGLMFGWKHAAWDVSEATEREMFTKRPVREDAKTVFWLYETVAPLLARLHNEGSLDFGTFYTEAVFPLMKSRPEDTIDRSE